MTETSKSYRIRTDVGKDNTKDYITVSADLIQDYDTFEVLSVDIKSKDAYQLHNSNYGVVVGRVIANNGFGIPNAKVSIFIEADTKNGVDVGNIYPFHSSVGRDKNGVRYNLLPNERVDGCHQVVGTFPTKRYALDNDVILEVFDHYYTYTTKTNNSGDYMICGVPTGSHTIHMDLDLSDCGILSQKPRDFVYKGYTIEQFETPTKFKGGTDYNNLSQIFTQDQVVNVNPFWGNSDLGETIGVSRCDIDVNFKFEPTCVFMGSIVSDNSSNGFSKKCIPTDAMGYMDELVTGEGKIEMIRKTPGGSVEEFSIKGNKLINANGVWCYQIPMNLDYMVTDEYGNMVPTDNPDKGIPTRASVRFRISMDDNEENPDYFYRAKVLVPHNPQIVNGVEEKYDYEFGSYTRDDSFRDLFWNNVYSVKSYIPRIQKNNNWKKEKFSGIKHCNKFGPNNPMPYNNIRIKLPLMFTIMCAILKTFIFLVKVTNTVIAIIGYVFAWIGTHLRLPFISIPDGDFVSGCGPLSGKFIGGTRCLFRTLNGKALKMHLIVLKDGLCPDLENWFFAPMFYQVLCPDGGDTCLLEYSGTCKTNLWFDWCDNCECHYSNLSHAEYQQLLAETGVTETISYNILKQTINYALGRDENGDEYETDENGNHINGIDADDPHSIDDQNADPDDETHCLTTNTDYLLPCVEMNLAQEYNVINFDFYNDWINGVIYNPRWVRFLKKKTRFLWITWANEKIKGCMDDTSVFSKQRKYVQQCSIGYQKNDVNGYELITKVESPINTKTQQPSNYLADLGIIGKQIVKGNNFHKKSGLTISRVFGSQGGICHQATTMKGQKVYYLKPCEFKTGTGGNRKTILYATDIILLGTFNDCDLNGIPKTFTHLASTTYVMPTNLALTNMDTNGPLYATNNGTICVGKNTDQGVNASNTAATVVSGVTEVDQTNEKVGPLGEELKYYQNSDSYRIADNSFFGDNNTANDTIALTEAAGISWDYTGPGQGVINKDRMYYPGGHFLGLTCVNSQTNIKSCINLSRICEIGANMSQRHEKVREIGPDGMKFTYTAPSGFISGDEISDSDFRAMFATLNKKRLIATKRNPKTGYKFYDFEFSNPINFNGAFNDVVYGDYLSSYNPSVNMWPYNRNIPVIEENLSPYGILLGYLREDYDADEPGNTQTRTREMASVDYYMFRFGINYENFDTNNNSRKFLVLDSSNTTNETLYYLPQYENSFYFYFGLKQGATALDEFNKQFYAECDEIKLKQSPRLILASTVDFCNATGNIHVIVEGLSAPYQYVKIYCKETGVSEQIDPIQTQNEDELSILSRESFFYPEGANPKDLPFGTYVVSIMDADEIEISSEIKVGVDLFNYDLTTINFTMPVYGSGIVGSRNIYQGGFVLIENFVLDYELDEEVTFSFRLYENGSLIGEYEHIDDIGYLAYGVKPYCYYDLCVVWRCEGDDEHVVKLEDVMFLDNRDIDLRLGDKNIHSISCVNEDLLRYMSENFWFDTSYNISDDGYPTDADRWFLRKMFFRESNLSDFDSHVYASNGCKKVLWGVAQRNGGVNNNMIVVGNERLYCSERMYDLPPGSYLDDTRTRKPTYGISNCEVQEEIRGTTATNCTYQYCAQAYKGKEVAGCYHGTYSRENGIVLDAGYFHEKYGCVFKPLPSGNLIFLEYNSISDLKNKIDEKTGANYGVIYPTFIYPVMKRPFFGNFSLRLFNGFGINISDFNGEISYSIAHKEFLNNALLGIHNGVTYNKRFGSIYVLSNESWGYEDVRSADTYNITLTSNTDRVYECYYYEDTPSCLNDTIFYRQFAFGAFEGYPSSSVCGYDASLLTNSIHVYGAYNFYNNLSYRVSGETDLSTEKITTVFGEGNTDHDIDYYIGCYDKKTNNIEMFVEPSNGTDMKYAYRKIEGGQNEYAVLCRFNEDERIHETKWYTNVYVNIRIQDVSELYIRYKYVNNFGSEVTYDEYLLTMPGQELSTTSHPIGINELLGNIANGFFFERVVSGETSTVSEPMPFTPVMNYVVLNGDEDQPIVAYNREYFGPDFGQLIQRMITRGNLRPIDRCDTLPIGQISGKKMFGIGVKTIPSSEDNEVTSHIYKVYPNPFRDRFFSDAGDYSLIVEPEFYGNGGGYGNTYSFGKGSHYKDISIDVNSYPCSVIITLENNSPWCYFVHDNIACYGTKEIEYAGTTIPIKLYVTENTDYDGRICTLKIQSFYGGLRDTVLISIDQKGIRDAKHIHLKFEQTKLLTPSEWNDLCDGGGSYLYRFIISSNDFPTFDHQENLYLTLCGYGKCYDFTEHTYRLLCQCTQGNTIPYTQGTPYVIPYPLHFYGATYNYTYSTINPSYEVNEQFHVHLDDFDIEIPSNSPLGDYVIDTQFVELDDNN